MDDSGYSSSSAVAMNNSGAIVGGGDPDESFDMLANMPPTPGGLVPPALPGGSADSGSDNDGEESFTDMLGIRDSSPTTPAALTAEEQGLRRSARLSTAGKGNRTGVLSASVGKGRRVGLPVAAGGGGGGGRVGGDNGVTPRSSRRDVRRENGQPFPERAPTPGTAFGDGDDPNASFR